jgi:hypothetical protein
MDRSSQEEQFGKSDYEVSIAHHARFTRITVTGHPTMEQMLVVVRVIGETCDRWGKDAILFDATRCETDFSRGEQFRIGEEAAACLGHLGKMAALVAIERFTGVTEQGARRSGANARVFTSREEAVAWLNE